VISYIYSGNRRVHKKQVLMGMPAQYHA